MVVAGRLNHNLILAALLVIAAAGCSKEGPRNDGGQHTGGGEVSSSSPEQVRTALEQALALAAEPDPSKNVVAQFWNTWGRVSKKEFVKNPAHLFPKINAADAATSFDLTKDAAKFESPVLQALKRNKLTLVESGDCLKSKTLMHTDASVSDFSVNADLCFSIGNLMRIPPSTLLREILSLVVHEASHLGGAGEDEAIGWQNEFSAYFGARFGDLDTDAVSKDTLKTLGEARILLSRAQRMASVDPKDSKIFGNMGKLTNKLSSLPYFADPMALELKTKPLRSDLIENYSNSVLALIQKITIRFEIKSDVLKVKGMRVPIEFMPEDKVVPTLLELGHDLAQIEENFLAFLGGSPEARSVCVLPEGVGQLNFPADPPGTVKPLAVPERCTPPR